MQIIKPSPFIKDVAHTTIASLITVVSLILVTRVLAHGLGPEGFGAYSLARRIVTTIAPFSTLYLGVALARYISISKEDRYYYLLCGLVLSVVPCLSVLIIGLLFTNELTNLVFHNQTYSSLFRATLFMILGYSCYCFIYAFYQGQRKIWLANLWQLWVVAFGPLGVAVIYANSGKEDLIMFLMGVVCFTAFFPLAIYSYKAISSLPNIAEMKTFLKKLSRYSLPRLPGGLLLPSLLTIGPFFAPHFGSVEDAGFLVVGQIIFRVLEGLMVGFGFVALPKVAELLTDGQDSFLQERVTDIVSFIFHVGVFATFQLVLWSDHIVLIWLGKQYANAIPLVKIILLAITPYIAYVMFRSVIDAIEERAVITRNLFIAFLITAATCLLLGILGLGAVGLAIGTSVGILSLGWLTVLFLWKRYTIDISGLRIKECVLLNLVCAFTGLCLKRWLEAIFNGVPLILLASLLVAILGFTYCLVLWKLKTGWIIELSRRIVGTTSK